MNAVNLFLLVTTPSDCSSYCYQAIATTILSCFASVDNMASIYGIFALLFAMVLNALANVLFDFFCVINCNTEYMFWQFILPHLQLAHCVENKMVELLAYLLFIQFSSFLISK